MLLDIWATWCGPCQKPMAHNQEMLEKNEEKWKDRVRIVAVSVDDSKEELF
jgi:thiol-disulfide isomerase/thioredoxin